SARLCTDTSATPCSLRRCSTKSTASWSDDRRRKAGLPSDAGKKTTCSAEFIAGLTCAQSGTWVLCHLLVGNRYLEVESSAMLTVRPGLVLSGHGSPAHVTLVPVPVVRARIRRSKVRRGPFPMSPGRAHESEPGR